MARGGVLVGDILTLMTPTSFQNIVLNNQKYVVLSTKLLQERKGSSINLDIVVKSHLENDPEVHLEGELQILEPNQVS